MITQADVLSAIDQEVLSAGKIFAIPMQMIVERLELRPGSTDFTLLENILDVLTTTGKLKRINGHPPMYLKL